MEEAWVPRLGELARYKLNGYEGTITSIMASLYGETMVQIASGATGVAPTHTWFSIDALEPARPPIEITPPPIEDGSVERAQPMFDPSADISGTGGGR